MLVSAFLTWALGTHTQVSMLAPAGRAGPPAPVCSSHTIPSSNGVVTVPQRELSTGDCSLGDETMTFSAEAG